MFKSLLCNTIFILTATVACSPENVGRLRADFSGTAHSTDTFRRAESTPGVSILTDSNRDGHIDESDDLNTPWSWNGQGALVIPNLDDDDRNGLSDCSDEVINGVTDEKDLTPVIVSFEEKGKGLDKNLQLEISASSESAPVRWFLSTTAGWVRVENKVSLNSLLEQARNPVQLAIETCAFSSPTWDGFITLSLRSPDNRSNVQRTLRVSPFLMIPNTQPTESLFISRDTQGRYDNTRMFYELPIPLLFNSTNLRVFKTDVWQEMWMQDTMEIGYAETPLSRMHFVLNAPRGLDRFGRTLLAPNVGYLEITKPRAHSDAGDGWMDWFGNLEVSPPTPKFPHGRIYYGRNPKTGSTLHTDIVDFLEAQELQKPVALDVGWLFIKHVDEMLTFWPDRTTGKFVAVMPSPRLAADLLDTTQDELNQSVQKQLDQIIEGDDLTPPLAEIFGLDSQMIRFAPLLYSEGEYGAVGRWSNPVNAVTLTKGILFGRTDLPDPIQRNIQQTIRTLKLSPIGVDDSAYQPKLGNVHCATNTLRSFPRSPFWKR